MKFAKTVGIFMRILFIWMLFSACTAEPTIPPDDTMTHIDEDPDWNELLFEQFSDSNCSPFAIISLGEINIENNVWNAGNLEPDSYSQCIYAYDEGHIQLLGWKWAYPANAFGVNAYPEIIFGWKPWHPSSTTPDLPRQIHAIQKAKVTYDVEVQRNEGAYNLAFDCWINGSPIISPQNIQFELMIWEDAHNLDPFGEFQATVNTSNGEYRFYMGEPTWEPPGSNWIYLAFVREGYRSKGTVDVDEFLTYLVNEGIVSENSYLATIEFGNEVGNSTGQSIVKQFEVDFE